MRIGLPCSEIDKAFIYLKKLEYAMTPNLSIVKHRSAELIEYHVQRIPFAVLVAGFQKAQAVVLLVYIIITVYRF